MAAKCITLVDQTGDAACRLSYLAKIGTKQPKRNQSRGNPGSPNHPRIGGTQAKQAKRKGKGETGPNINEKGSKEGSDKQK